MVFNKKFQISDPTPTFTFNGEVIEECSEYKYLGVIFLTKGQRFKNNFNLFDREGHTGRNYHQNVCPQRCWKRTTNITAL